MLVITTLLALVLFVGMVVGIIAFLEHGVVGCWPGWLVLAGALLIAVSGSIALVRLPHWTGLCESSEIDCRSEDERIGALELGIQKLKEAK